MFMNNDDKMRLAVRNPRSPFQPSLKEFLFYRLLLISPSYWKVANNIKSGLGEASIKNADESEKDVYKMFEKAGDVYNMPFEEWWEKLGFKIFKRDLPKSLSIEVPNEEDYDSHELESNAKQLISLLETIKDASESAEYQMLSTGPNLPEFVRKLGMLEAKVLLEHMYGDSLKQWRIAIAFGFNKNRLHSKDLKCDCDTSDLPKDEREYLSDQVRRNMNELLQLSENAARGIYPSTTQSSSKLTFKDIHLFSILAQSRQLDLELEDRDKRYRQSLRFPGGRPAGITRFLVLNELEKRELQWREIVDDVLNAAEKLLK